MKKTNSARSAITKVLQRPESRFRVIVLILGCIVTPQVARPAESFAFCWASEVGRSGATTHFYSGVFAIEPSSRTESQVDFDRYLRGPVPLEGPEALAFRRVAPLVLLQGPNQITQLEKEKTR